MTLQSTGRLTAAFLTVAALSVWNSPALAADESRLEIKTLYLSKSSTNAKKEVTTEAGAGETETTVKEKSEDSYFYSALPVLEITTFQDRLAAGASIYGFLFFFGGDMHVGYRLDSTKDAGVYLSATYRFSKESVTTEPESGPSVDVKSNEASRDLTLGPYFRALMPLGGGPAIETFTVLGIIRESSDNSASGETEERSGMGLNFDLDWLVPIGKRVRYSLGAGLAWRQVDGKTTDSSGSTKTETKLKEETTMSYYVSPLGLRFSF